LLGRDLCDRLLTWDLLNPDPPETHQPDTIKPYYHPDPVVRALMSRLEWLDPKNVGYIKQLLNRYHRLKHLPKRRLPARFKKEATCDLILQKIDSARVGKRTHHPEVIAVQAKYIDIKLALDESRAKTRNMHLWIAANAPVFLEDIQNIPCGCNYSVSLHQADIGRLALMRTPIRLIHGLLAHLHNTTPSFIEKLLKPKPR
jgi:hypothetical protein